MSIALYDPADALYGRASPELEPFEPVLRATSETYSAPSPPPSPEDRQAERIVHVADTEILIRAIGPNNPELHHAPLPRELPADSSTAMTERGEGNDPEEPAKAEPRPDEYDSILDIKELTATASAAVREHEAASSSRQDVGLLEPESRHDSAQDKVPQLSPEKKNQISDRSSPSLRLQTPQALPRRAPPPDTIATSPQLSKHIITTSEGIATLPAFQSISPAKDGSASSPQGEKLPGFHQVIALAPLDELAEVATQQDPRGGAPLHHTHSHGSTTAQSPMIPYHYTGMPQSSPSPYYVRSSARSPTSTISGDHFYTSPTQYPGSAYYSDRRSSAPTETHQPPRVPSLPTTSSSGDSHGATNSSMDGYSTAQTTPGEASDATPRPILPPPVGMPQSAVVMSTGGFECDYPGCNSAPFQTQYLLSSHKNVHSQVRNHYCPVKECPRSEGGKGFKRKNEMIRHGLVHDSPGYVCPFCPDKEHKYPRPDNLQRHVRVHHMDKDKDDPLLRDVLAQRREGLGKTRRRRANTASST